MSHYTQKMSTASENERLDSWKAIARHLGRSVRTVRRWEAQEGLPVRRHMHRTQGSVYALRAELDAWLAGRSAQGSQMPASAAHEDASPDTVLAVLPLHYIGPDAAQAWIADGLHDELISALSGLRTLRVISRTSSIALKGSSEDARRIGSRLGARYLLEGSVRSTGPTLKVSVSLIDAQRDTRIWSDAFSGPMESLLDLQDRISQQVVGALQLPLSADDKLRLTSHPFGSLSAWQCATQARQSSLRWRRDAIDHAVELLNRGLALEPDNPGLYAMLGRTWLQYREAGIDGSEEPLSRAAHCAERIEALDPHAAAGYNLRGWLAFAKNDIQGAVSNLRQALQRDWSDVDALGVLSNCYLITGRIALAEPLISQLLTIDPLTPLTRCLPGWAAVLCGRIDAALDPYREMFEMDPGNPMARLFYLWLLVLADRDEQAAELLRAAGDGAPDSLAASVAVLLLTAKTTPERFTELAQPDPRQVPPTDIFPRLLAQANALAGCDDQAVMWLARAVDFGFINYPYLAQHDPILTRLRGTAAYDTLLEEVRQRWDAFDA